MSNLATKLNLPIEVSVGRLSKPETSNLMYKTLNLYGAYKALTT